MIEACVIKDDQGNIITLPRPARHHNIIWYMNSIGYDVPIIGEQGFINEEGKFLKRKEAKIEAIKCNQILKGRGTTLQLYSEDLWQGNLDENKPGGAPLF